MRKRTSHPAVGGWLLACLMLAFSQTLLAQCLAYPRDIDQVFICYNKDDQTVKLDPAATIHNPVRFTFPEIPSDVTVSFDYNTDNYFPQTFAIPIQS